jgi:E3 Ubiquitin ligase
MTTLNIILLCAGGLLLIAAVICVTAALRGEDRLLAILDTPTSSALDIHAIHRNNGAYGQACEVAGVIECDASLSGPLSGQACVAYSHSLTWEEWGKPGMFDKRSGTGDLVYRTGGVEFDDRQAPTFWVRDASGRVLVDPINAELDLEPIDARYEVVTSGYGEIERRTRREEKGLPLGQTVYVLGYLGERQGQPVIQRHASDSSKKFLISYRAEQTLTRANRRRAALFYFVAGISGSAGMLLIAWRLLLLRGR